MIQLLVLIVAGVVIYAISRATGGRLGALQILAILVGVFLLLGGVGMAVCGGFVAVVPDSGMSGLRIVGLICLGIGALILYAGVWIVRATVRNAKARGASHPSEQAGGPSEPPIAPGS